MSKTARKGPHFDCGILDMRCLGPGIKGQWRCTAKCSDGVKYGAVINGKKGTVRFYA